MQLFTYLFRPLPFEVTSIFSAAAALDNLILLFVAILGLVRLFFRRKKLGVSGSENRLFFIIYSLLAWSVLSITTANLGISVRQKWMFAPMMIYLFIAMLKDRRISK